MVKRDALIESLEKRLAQRTETETLFTIRWAVVVSVGRNRIRRAKDKTRDEPEIREAENLLKELFQLDQPDLDFGLYRIMHAKSAEVTQFLDKDLLPQVKQAFSSIRPRTRLSWRRSWPRPSSRRRLLGADPETTPKVKELRDKLANDAVDMGALENEVYDHLFSFFRRYYSEGDFLAKRVYKPGVYAIPYEGEEVKLHWANRDQYYIKTSEYLRDYAFRLRPDERTESDARALSGWWTPPRASTATSRRPKARTAFSFLLLRESGRLHRRGERRTRHPLRIPPRDPYRLARGCARGQDQATDAERT